MVASRSGLVLITSIGTSLAYGPDGAWSNFVCENIYPAESTDTLRAVWDAAAGGECSRRQRH